MLHLCILLLSCPPLSCTHVNTSVITMTSANISIYQSRDNCFPNRPARPICLFFARWVVVQSRVTRHASPAGNKLCTAVVNSIDRSTEDRAPNRCLPFDGIGARHPGIVALSGHTPAANGNLVPAPGAIRDPEPQYHQKVNNDLGLYSLWNGLLN